MADDTQTCRVEVHLADGRVVDFGMTAPDLIAQLAAIEVARQWLARQRADNRDPMLDEGDCRLCGRPAGEGHELTDPCGIVANLLAALEGRGAHNEMP
jgi:hypothetical protein